MDVGSGYNDNSVPASAVDDKRVSGRRFPIMELIDPFIAVTDWFSWASVPRYCQDKLICLSTSLIVGFGLSEGLNYLGSSFAFFKDFSGSLIWLVTVLMTLWWICADTALDVRRYNAVMNNDRGWLVEFGYYAVAIIWFISIFWLGIPSSMTSQGIGKYMLPTLWIVTKIAWSLWPTSRRALMEAGYFDKDNEG